MKLEDIAREDPRPIVEFYEERLGRKVYAVDLTKCEVGTDNPDHIVIRIKT